MPVSRGSWYSQLPEFGWVDREDRPGSNALGVADSDQGIALPSRSTLGKWFNVTAPNGQTYRLQQTDVGPAARTGRGIDISAAAAHKMGYTPKDFPTDASFSFEPEDGSAMSYAPEPRRKMDLSSLLPQQQPQSGGGGFFDRLGAAGQTFSGSGGDLLSTLGALISGQRQDPQGVLGRDLSRIMAGGNKDYQSIAQQLYAAGHPKTAQDFLSAHLKDRALTAADARTKVLDEYRRDQLAATNDYRKAQLEKPILFKEKRTDPNTGEEVEVPILINPRNGSRRELTPEQGAAVEQRLGVTPPPPKITPPESDEFDLLSGTDPFSGDETPQPIQYTTPRAVPGQQAAPATTNPLYDRHKDILPPEARNWSPKIISEYVKKYVGSAGMAAGKQSSKSAIEKQREGFGRDLVLEDATRALDLANKNPLATGMAAQATNWIDSSPGGTLRNIVDGIESNISLERLQKLRTESPTGAGLGNVSDKDVDLLKKAMGSLKNAQTKEAFTFNMKRLQREYFKTIHGYYPRPGEVEAAVGATSGDASGPITREQAIEELRRRRGQNANSL